MLSEILGIYGILRLLFEMKFTAVPEFERQLDSLCQACRVLDLILELKRFARPINQGTIEELQGAMALHLRTHLAVYGDGYIRPKHHWLMDTPPQFLRDAVVLDAFVIERTHLAVKVLAEHIKNTRTFERSVLSGIACCLPDSVGACRSQLLGKNSTATWHCRSSCR